MTEKPNEKRASTEGPGVPGSAPDALQALLECARRGDPSCLAELRRAMDADPALWKYFSDLAGMVREGWVKQIAGSDLRVSEALARRAEAMKRDLAGPDASPLEVLVVERIIGCWTEVQWLDLIFAHGNDDGSKVAQFRLKRQESAQRRFLAATRALAQVRRLTAGVRIEINHRAVAGDDSDAAIRPASRLRSAMARENACDEALLAAG